MNSNTLEVKKILQYTFGIVPIVAGLDKFINFLTDWSMYISSGLVDILPFEISTFISIVGIIEIGAGILVLLRPTIGAYVVMAWLILISIVLIFSGMHLDIAVRDLVMAIAAYSLAKLSGPNLLKSKLKNI